MIKYRPNKPVFFIAMAKKGFTQKKLSAVSGLNPSTISLFLNNKRLISTNSAKKIADALECDIESLFEIQIQQQRGEINENRI